MCIVDFENVVFTSREWNQLKDLCAVLSPFSEATELTEGEKSVTISMVVPTVLDLNTHLIEMEESRGQCRPIAKALRQSLLKRFSGIFVKTKMAKKNEREEPFGHDVYFIAAMLDPQFGLSWVDLDVSNSNIENATLQNQFREDLKRTLRDTLLAEVETMVDAETLQNLAAGTAGTDSPKDSPPSKCPRIFARYQAHRNHHQSALNASISRQRCFLRHLNNNLYLKTVHLDNMVGKLLILVCVMLLVSFSDAEGRGRKPSCGKMVGHFGCPEYYKAVCGSDGKTYSNECELCLHIQKCKNMLIVNDDRCGGAES
ncbi:hypothetical protein DPEC_G00186310 [Dallia pectoralis]|uniref:Uncharacterized protein n=1 Tax=Dallia pectoralis TaxID=75939 RepID=A0ACC2GBF2_DALPE|nr:hypothetical protein DPEC_G00186310 [Dallia pectoralis]